MTNSTEKSWRKALLTESATVRQAIEALDAAAIQIALVISAQEELIGTITDGDIRRGLLRGLALHSPIESVIHRDPFVVPPGMERELVIHLMRANKLLQLPVVDPERRLIGVHLWDELIVPEDRPNTIVIMAGGVGSRLRPYTENCPKPMLPVAGKPMLEHIIERARAQGFRRFVLAVHYLGHLIEEYFGDGGRWQVHIDYLHEQTPLGTAGALTLLNPHPEHPFVVSNGDVLTDIHYGALLDFHSRQNAVATMAVRQHEWQYPYGVVRTRGVEIIGFEEKPVTTALVNAGIYVLDPSAIELLSGIDRCDMPTLFERLRDQNKRTLVYPMHEPWLDVGRPEDYASAQDARKP
jgi:dTDP-glucose pyrophosphorylase